MTLSCLVHLILVVLAGGAFSPQLGGNTVAAKRIFRRCLPLAWKKASRLNCQCFRSLRSSAQKLEAIDQIEKLNLILRADLSLEQVAVRARPVNQREKKLECDICVSWQSLESSFSKAFAEFA